MSCLLVTDSNIRERVEDAVAEVLPGRALRGLGHLRLLDAPQLALDIFDGDFTGHALAQVSQTPQQRWQAAVVLRSGGDGFPARIGAHAAGNLLMAIREVAGVAQQRSRDDGRLRECGVRDEGVAVCCVPSPVGCLLREV